MLSLAQEMLGHMLDASSIPAAKIRCARAGANNGGRKSGTYMSILHPVGTFSCNISYGFKKVCRIAQHHGFSKRVPDCSKLFYSKSFVLIVQSPPKIRETGLQHMCEA